MNSTVTPFVFYNVARYIPYMYVCACVCPKACTYLAQEHQYANKLIIYKESKKHICTFIHICTYIHVCESALFVAVAVVTVNSL